MWEPTEITKYMHEYGICVSVKEVRSGLLGLNVYRRTVTGSPGLSEHEAIVRQLSMFVDDARIDDPDLVSQQHITGLESFLDELGSRFSRHRGKANAYFTHEDFAPYRAGTFASKNRSKWKVQTS